MIFEANDLFVAIAPVTKLSNSPQIYMMKLANMYDEIVMILDIFGIHEVLGSNWQHISEPMCFAFPRLCDIMADMLFNYNRDLVDDSRNTALFSYGPEGTSVKSIKHFA